MDSRSHGHVLGYGPADSTCGVTYDGPTLLYRLTSVLLPLPEDTFAAVRCNGDVLKPLYTDNSAAAEKARGQYFPPKFSAVEKLFC